MWRPLLRGVVDLVAPRSCPGCDQLLPPGADGFCDACAPLLEPLRLGPACYAYGGPLAAALTGLKYEGRIDWVAPLAALWCDRAQGHMGRVDSVVPMPLHRTRLLQRGYNSVALLAEPLAQALGVPLETKALRRTRATHVQASLPRGERDNNVRGAFEADVHPQRRRLLLVDDVRTTGATLRAASHALYLAGATSVRVMALAGVEP